MSLLEATREAHEFKTLQSKAENTKLYYYQKMWQLIVKTLDLDRIMLKKQLWESFFKPIVILIETKVFYKLQMMPEDSAMAKTFQENGGSKTASAYTCLKIFNGQHDYPDHELELNIEKVKKYLDTDADTIKEGILTLFNKEEAEKIISTHTNFDEEIM